MSATATSTATRQDLEKKAVEIARDIVRMTTAAGSGHPSSALSLVHLVTVLLFERMRHDPENPWHPAADRLVLSEGHAVPVVYAAWAHLGGAWGDRSGKAKVLNREELPNLRKIDSVLDGHPNPALGFPLFDVATGSLGQGLSAACGLALAARQDAVEKRIYVLIGDGESREGQIAEALDFQIEHGLHEVVPILNCNGLGQSDPVSGQQSPDVLARKLEACGFAVRTVDGHDVPDLRTVLADAATAERPTAIVATTVKGWGVTAFQESNLHGKTLDPDATVEAMADLDRVETEAGVADRVPELPGPPAPPEPSAPKETAPPSLGPPDFESLLADDATTLATVRGGKLATRKAYGLALRELATLDPRIIGLDGDVKNSTYSEYLHDEAPGRFFECRIAEQNMVSVAAGLAAGGKIPFVSTFAKFLARAYDQVELALISRLPVKLCGSHAGANIGADGPSQMGLADATYFRAFTSLRDGKDRPLLATFHPCCAHQAWHAVRLMAAHPYMAYLRTIRSDLPILYDADEPFSIGSMKTLREGTDCVLIAAGYMVHVALEAAGTLQAAGISASVHDAWSMPLHAEPLLRAVSVAGPVVTLEDNYAGALGSEVASVLAAEPDVHRRVEQLFVRQVPKSGRAGGEVLRTLSLDAESVAARVREILG